MVAWSNRRNKWKTSCTLEENARKRYWQTIIWKRTEKVFQFEGLWSTYIQIHSCRSPKRTFSRGVFSKWLCAFTCSLSTCMNRFWSSQLGNPHGNIMKEILSLSFPCIFKQTTMGIDTTQTTTTPEHSKKKANNQDFRCIIWKKRPVTLGKEVFVPLPSCGRAGMSGCGALGTGA